MQLFYITSPIDNGITILDKEESTHIVKVLRMQENEEIFLTDGKGNLFSGIILEANAKHCQVKIISEQKDYEKRDFYIHLAIAPTKNINRMEWLIEKVTEIGIDEITFLITEHSERKTVNTDRLEKIVVAAMKQSIKAFKPKLNSMVKFIDLIKNNDCQKKYLCCCPQNIERIFIKDDYQPKQSVIIFIGPEGDFSDNEITTAQNYGAKLITLGNQRLRTETAALYAINNIHFLNQ